MIVVINYYDRLWLIKISISQSLLHSYNVINQIKTFNHLTAPVLGYKNLYTQCPAKDSI